MKTKLILLLVLLQFHFTMNSQSVAYHLIRHSEITINTSTGLMDKDSVWVFFSRVQFEEEFNGDNPRQNFLVVSPQGIDIDKGYVITYFSLSISPELMKRFPDVKKTRVKLEDLLYWPINQDKHIITWLGNSYELFNKKP